MSLEYSNNVNGGQDMYFLTPNHQISLSTSYFAEEGNGGSEMGGYLHEGVGEREGEKRLKLCARGHWRPHEDAKLKELVALHGPQNWNLIAEKLEGRSGKSCRLRWFNQLDPRINKRSFNEDEEDRLLTAHRMYGNKWALIARLFPGRTDNSVKNHWHVIMARRHREQNSIYRRRKPSSSPTSHQKQFSNVQGGDVARSRVCNVDVVGDSGSTCTELSLSPSSNGLASFSLSRSALGCQWQNHNVVVQIGPSGEKKNLTRGDMGYDPFYTNVGPPSIAVELDQSNNSDSNSDITAADSVLALNMTNNNPLFKFSENQSGGYEEENIRRPFIDFLGVGPTF